MILIDNRNTTNPYINLAIEEYLVRHADCSAGDYLLLYVNQPCIVSGKNQSIYKEVNAKYLHGDTGVKLCRRISGGGTVFHDAGNLSFAFISQFADYKVNNYNYFNSGVIAALNKAGVAAAPDERNNIFCEGKKISGNAQFTNRKNIISHGTLLFNADIERLRAGLRQNTYRSFTRAVASMRSPVANISQFTDYFASIQHLKEYLVNELRATSVKQFTESEWAEITQLAETKFNTDAWIFNRSPKTTIVNRSYSITIEDGLITETVLPDSEAGLLLKGQPFRLHTIQQALLAAGKQQLFQQLQTMFLGG